MLAGTKSEYGRGGLIEIERAHPSSMRMTSMSRTLSRSLKKKPASVMRG
jgi:hypothetical protein